MFLQCQEIVFVCACILYEIRITVIIAIHCQHHCIELSLQVTCILHIHVHTHKAESECSHAKVSFSVDLDQVWHVAFSCGVGFLISFNSLD